MKRAKSAQLGGPTQFYGTPPWAVHRLLDATDLPSGRWLEPGCGACGIVRAVHSYGGPYQQIEWTGVEVDWVIHRAGARRAWEANISGTWKHADFLQWDKGDHFDVSITNPPNDLAEEFVTHALTMSTGVVCFQPLQFYASESREEFFKVSGLRGVYVLPNRPQFRGDGSPMQTYAWFIFRKGHVGDATIRRLALTPKEVRKAALEQANLECAEDFGFEREKESAA